MTPHNTVERSDHKGAHGGAPHNAAVHAAVSRQPDPPAGEWLYKLQGEILGPVPSPEIIERMFAGEVDESTEVAPDEGDWRTIQAVPDFHPFLYQAKAKIRAQQARAEAERAARKRRRRNIIKVALGAVVLVIISFLASYFLIVSRPWRSDDAMRAWADKHVPLLRVASVAPAVGDTREMDEGIDIDQILIDDAPTLVAIKNNVRRKPHKGRKKSHTGSTPGKPGGKKVKGSGASGDKPERPKTASLGTLSNEEIIDKVYSKSNLRRMYTCIRSAIRRHQQLPPVITIEFTISNDGRAGKVRMEDVKLEGGQIHKCFSRKVAQLRFRSFSGQVRNVTIPFKIKQ